MGSYLLLLVISVSLLETVFHSTHLALADIDPACFSDCACCIDRVCGQGPYFPNTCTKGCIEAHRSARCYELCADNCKSCPVKGKCQTCYDGFYLYQNNQCLNCPKNCKTCTSSTFCTNCKEGYENRYGSIACEYSLCPGNCLCTQSNCVACEQGFFDTGSSCSSLCPIHCLSCSSLAECHECKAGYYNGNKLVNSINLLFHNCTHQCRETCVSCSSYDHCLKCIHGKYGPQCLKNCSIGCVENTCSIDTGTCDCNMNFDGSKCDGCVTGNYGDVCDKICPKHCKGDVCDRWSGNCKEGCETNNFTGEKCDSCVLGKHGLLCTEACPYNCSNNRCERNNGICSEGCAELFIGSRCTQCEYGKYGRQCELDCPGNCLNNICDRQSGNCLKCNGHFEGIKCNHCRPGFFGPDCNQSCSLHCLHGTCDISDGKCDSGCTDNFSGDRCCIEGENCVECLTNTECGTCTAGYFGCLCDKNCSADCAESCNIFTGACKDIQNQQEETNPLAISAALGSISLLVNIGLLVYIVVKRIRKRRRAQTEHTYDNQLATSETQFFQGKTESNVPQTEAAKRCIYDEIHRENETEHEYNI